MTRTPAQLHSGWVGCFAWLLTLYFCRPSVLIKSHKTYFDLSKYVLFFAWCLFQRDTNESAEAVTCFSLSLVTFPLQTQCNMTLTEHLSCFMHWLCFTDSPRRASNKLLWKIPITLWMAVLSCCSSGLLSLVQYSSKSPRARAVSAEEK